MNLTASAMLIALFAILVRPALASVIGNASILGLTLPARDKEQTPAPYTEMLALGGSLIESLRRENQAMGNSLMEGSDLGMLLMRLARSRTNDLGASYAALVESLDQ